jgi:hypothetical protein
MITDYEFLGIAVAVVVTGWIFKHIYLDPHEPFGKG